MADIIIRTTSLTSDVFSKINNQIPIKNDKNDRENDSLNIDLFHIDTISLRLTPNININATGINQIHLRERAKAYERKVHEKRDTAN
jgi:hypothetical protein